MNFWKWYWASIFVTFKFHTHRISDPIILSHHVGTYKTWHLFQRLLFSVNCCEKKGWPDHILPFLYTAISAVGTLHLKQKKDYFPTRNVFLSCLIMKEGLWGHGDEGRPIAMHWKQKEIKQKPLFKENLQFSKIKSPRF